MASFSPELLRQARELAGLTAAELAERAGLHRVTVANYERGMHCPAETWARIEKALKAALEEHARAVGKAQKRLRAA
jgi:transcriptional regulator with XRE-family HTH domain